MMMPEITAPCPFCGERARVMASKMGSLWAVGCDKCGSWGPAAETEDGAIELWNRRANAGCDV